VNQRDLAGGIALGGVWALFVVILLAFISLAGWAWRLL
jgi:hypothetical protein